MNTRQSARKFRGFRGCKVFCVNRNQDIVQNICDKGDLCKWTSDPKLSGELIKGYKNPEDLVGENGLLKQLTKALLERAMSAELTHTLRYEKGEQTAEKPTANRRNGSSPKTVSSKNGEMQIAVPRDRSGEFEPQIIKKHQRRFDGFDDLILSLYSRGLSTREIQGHIEEIYGVEVSPELISNVTEAVQEEVREWQSRTLDSVYPILYLDALRVKIRVDGRVQNRCIYIGIGVNVRGKKETLGLWSSETEGAKFWLSVLTELQNRGVRDVLIACVDGLKGFPRSDRIGVPEDFIADLHSSPNQKLSCVCVVPGAKACGGGFEADLRGGGG